MKNSSYNQRGFTLIELMVGMVCSLFLAYGAWQFFGSFMGVYFKQTTKLAVSQNMIVKFGVLEQKIRFGSRFEMKPELLAWENFDGKLDSLRIHGDSLFYNQMLWAYPIRAPKWCVIELNDVKIDQEDLAKSCGATQIEKSVAKSDTSAGVIILLQWEYGVDKLYRSVVRVRDGV